VQPLSTTTTSEWTPVESSTERTERSNQGSSR
jgi:hypothetical protein